MRVQLAHRNKPCQAAQPVDRVLLLLLLLLSLLLLLLLKRC